MSVWLFLSIISQVLSISTNPTFRSQGLVASHNLLYYLFLASSMCMVETGLGYGTEENQAFWMKLPFPHRIVWRFSQSQFWGK